jgi:hypothetical protein
LKSSAVKRTCTAFPLAAPLGSIDELDTLEGEGR